MNESYYVTKWELMSVWVSSVELLVILLILYVYIHYLMWVIMVDFCVCVLYIKHKLFIMGRTL